ncbi:mobilization protein [Simonsiella muelleri]|uniref:mobilization protein n=1 Tax=Simonsiella muelleri TaxID=72 RepID=UPI0023F38B24|nr:mobilization protein [Simonsiella muelleri]
MSRLRKINVYLNRSKTISLYRTDDEIQFLKQFAKEKFGKANVSLAIRYLLLEELKKSEQQPESEECTNQDHQDNHVEKQKFHRFSVTFRGKHSAYLRQKARSERRSINSVICEIISEYMKKNPILNNDDVQALYQSNYQLLQFGRHINQLARQFNAGTPPAITTQDIDKWIEFLHSHIGVANTLLENHRIEVNPLDNPTHTGR